MPEDDLRKTILTFVFWIRGYIPVISNRDCWACLLLGCVFVFSTISLRFLCNIPPLLQSNHTTNLVYLFDLVKLSVCIQSLYSSLGWLSVAYVPSLCSAFCITPSGPQKVKPLTWRMGGKCGWSVLLQNFIQ